jgi:hypothetical protein
LNVTAVPGFAVSYREPISSNAAVNEEAAKTVSSPPPVPAAAAGSEPELLLQAARRNRPVMTRLRFTGPPPHASEGRIYRYPFQVGSLCLLSSLRRRPST